MSINLSALMKQRYDTAANWTAQNPTLLAGEFGIESDTKRWKVGDGATAWTSLLYSNGGTYPLVNADIAAAAEIAVSKLADGSARQLLQTDAAGTGVEWTSNVSIPGVLAVTAGTAALPGIAVSGDPNTGIFSPGADQLAISTSGTVKATIDSSGRLLVGTTTSVVGSIGSSTNWPAIAQFNSTSIASISLGLFHWSNYAVDLGGAGGGLGNGPDIVLARSNTNTQGVHVAVTNNILLGRINFSGSDGTQFINGACIAAAVNGTPGANDMPGRLVFSTTADGASSPTERMRIDSTGLMTLAGPGIKFPATQVASTDPNTLDDYEEGTFTPTIISSGGGQTATYSVTTARYTKIGRVVTLDFDVALSTVSGGSGDALLSGLPFNSGGNSAGTGVTGFVSGWATQAPTLLFSSSSTSSFQLRYVSSATATAIIPWANAVVGARMIGSITYISA